MTTKSSVSVSVIGLGKMGSALAQTLLRAGQQVIAYNRTLARSELIRQHGATVAVSLAEAIALSPVSLVSVSDYHAAEALFFAPDDGLNLAGKTIIQLSSGTPQEARTWSARCAELGAQSLTGAILAYPMHIGTPQAQFLISGPERLYASCKHLFELLGSPMHVGEGPGGASALDCAVLASSMLRIVGLLQGIELCCSEGVDPAMLLDISNGMEAVWPAVNKMMLQAVAARSYANPPASIDTWAATAGHIADIVARNRMEPLVSNMLMEIFGRAHATGLGSLDISALCEILRVPQSQ